VGLVSGGGGGGGVGGGVGVVVVLVGVCWWWCWGGGVLESRERMARAIASRKANSINEGGNRGKLQQRWLSKEVKCAGEVGALTES